MISFHRFHCVLCTLLLCGSVMVKADIFTYPQPSASFEQVSQDTSVSVSPWRIAVLLPLHADAAKRDKTMDRFYDFYAGTLLALKHHPTNERPMQVYFYDIKKSASLTQAVLTDSLPGKMDMIIGPVYASQVALATSYASATQTPLLIPFLSDVDSIEFNPWLLKFNPSPYVEADTLAKYLRNDSIHCVMIEAKNGEHVPTSVVALKRAIAHYHLSTSTTNIHSLLTDSFSHALRTDRQNLFIFNTERFSNLQTVLPHLLNSPWRDSIILFSHYTWAKEPILLEQIYTTAFYSSAISDSTYDADYHRFFNHPLSSMTPRYDLLGYDLMGYAIQLLERSSDYTLPADSADAWLYSGLQATIRMQRVQEGGGFENNHIQIIRK